MSQYLKLSKQMTSLIYKHGPNEAKLVALFQIGEFKKPSIVYPCSMARDALSHAWQHNYLAVAVEPNGLLRGHESGPEEGLTHDELMERLVSMACGETADGIAVVAAIAQYWDFRLGWELIAEGEEWPAEHDPRLLTLFKMYTDAGGEFVSAMSADEGDETSSDEAGGTARLAMN